MKIQIDIAELDNIVEKLVIKHLSAKKNCDAGLFIPQQEAIKLLKSANMPHGYSGHNGLKNLINGNVVRTNDKKKVSQNDLTNFINTYKNPKQ